MEEQNPTDRENVCDDNCESSKPVIEAPINEPDISCQNNNETPLKPESREIEIPIVGIRKNLPDGETELTNLFLRLPIGAKVYLKRQSVGDEFPGSISVWDDESKRIGSVSKTYRRYIELDVPKDAALPVRVSGHSAKDKCMYFKAVNKNGYADPFITKRKLEDGETLFPMAKLDKDLQLLTALVMTVLKGLEDEDTVSDHFLSTANKYAEICCSSLDGETTFKRGDIVIEMRQLEEKFPKLKPIREAIFERAKDLGRYPNDIKTEVYRSQYERIKQMAMKKGDDGLSPLDYYIGNLTFKNGGQLTLDIINKEIFHLSDLLSKELGGKYSECIISDEKFATSLYSLNYDWEAIYLLFTRRIKLDYLKENKNLLVSDAKTTPTDTIETRLETGLPLPRSINTKRAQTYFQKAIDNGLLRLENGRFSWNQIGKRGAKAQLAYFCGKVFEYEHSISGNVGTSFPEEELNELFGVKKMQSSLQQVHEAKNKQQWRRRIDELFE